MPPQKNQSEYEQFMRSQSWQNMRQAALNRDNHECQTCKHQDQLEVHHKVYSFPLEDQFLSDLITLCHWCHEAITCVIRNRRYSKRSYKPAETEAKAPIVGTFKNDATKFDMHDHRSCAPDFTQRANMRSDESLFKSLKASEQQARKDGRRFY